eukprot:GHVQ01019165.1.p1 GENE.GHVQ01019165.1~~GHVQ01019165.1.p1  ORF type:complete len:2445 (+),score=335.62 GHVQ01019165.1:539-7873(+)
MVAGELPGGTDSNDSQRHGLPFPQPPVVCLCPLTPSLQWDGGKGRGIFLIRPEQTNSRFVSKLAIGIVLVIVLLFSAPLWKYLHHGTSSDVIASASTGITFNSNRLGFRVMKALLPVSYIKRTAGNTVSADFRENRDVPTRRLQSPVSGLLTSGRRSTKPQRQPQSSHASLSEFLSLYESREGPIGETRDDTGDTDLTEFLDAYQRSGLGTRTQSPPESSQNSREGDREDLVKVLQAYERRVGSTVSTDSAGTDRATLKKIVAEYERRGGVPRVTGEDTQRAELKKVIEAYERRTAAGQSSASEVIHGSGIRTAAQSAQSGNIISNLASRASTLGDRIAVGTQRETVANRLVNIKGNVSVVGRVGQNSDINGEYVYHGDPSSGAVSRQVTGARGYYSKHVDKDGDELKLYLFYLESEASGAERIRNRGVWAIGETLNENKKVRAFVKDNAVHPVRIKGTWLVFEHSAGMGDPNVVAAEDPLTKVVAVSCMNRIKDGMEEDVDCGGECRACETFRSCSLSGPPPKSFTHGTCPIVGPGRSGGSMSHGETCEYKCPIGYKSTEGIHNQCYDGRLMEIKRGPDCEPVYKESPCDFIEMSGAPPLMTINGHSVSCNGVFIRHSATGDGGQTSYLWHKPYVIPTTSLTASEGTLGSQIDSKGEVFLYWLSDDAWTCTVLSSPQFYGRIPDRHPERFNVSSKDVTMTSQVSRWVADDGEKQAKGVTMKCYDPLVGQASPSSCPTFDLSGWDELDNGTQTSRNRKTTMSANGKWLQDTSPSSQDALKKSEQPLRHRYVLDRGSDGNKLYMYWISRGYWVVDGDTNPAKFLAYVYSPSVTPPAAARWTIWHDGLWRSSGNEVMLECRDTLSTHERRSSSRSTDNQLVGQGRNDVPASAARVAGVARGTFAGLLKLQIKPAPQELLVKPGTYKSYSDVPCLYMDVKGTAGYGDECAGIWTRVLGQKDPYYEDYYRLYFTDDNSNEAAVTSPRPAMPESGLSQEVFWYKLQPDSSILYFYWFGGRWGCTANTRTKDDSIGGTGRDIVTSSGAKGYIKLRSTERPPKELQHTTSSARAVRAGREGSSRDISGSGTWFSQDGVVETRSTVKCYDPISESARSLPVTARCKSLDLSGFSGAAKVFNGSWRRQSAIDGSEPTTINGRPHYVFAPTSRTANPAHLFYDTTGLWVISDPPKVNSTTEPVTNPYYAYSYSSDISPSGGIWTYFSEKRNRAVMAAVSVSCGEDEFRNPNPTLNAMSASRGNTRTTVGRRPGRRTVTASSSSQSDGSNRLEPFSGTTRANGAARTTRGGTGSRPASSGLSRSPAKPRPSSVSAATPSASRSSSLSVRTSHSGRGGRSTPTDSTSINSSRPLPPRRPTAADASRPSAASRTGGNISRLPRPPRTPSTDSPSVSPRTSSAARPRRPASASTLSPVYSSSSDRPSTTPTGPRGSRQQPRRLGEAFKEQLGGVPRALQNTASLLVGPASNRSRYRGQQRNTARGESSSRTTTSDRVRSSRTTPVSDPPPTGALRSHGSIILEGSENTGSEDASTESGQRTRTTGMASSSTASAPPTSSVTDRAREGGLSLDSDLTRELELLLNRFYNKPSDTETGRVTATRSRSEDGSVDEASEKEKADSGKSKKEELADDILRLLKKHEEDEDIENRENLVAHVESEEDSSVNATVEVESPNMVEVPETATTFSTMSVSPTQELLAGASTDRTEEEKTERDSPKPISEAEMATVGEPTYILLKGPLSTVEGLWRLQVKRTADGLAAVLVNGRHQFVKVKTLHTDREELDVGEYKHMFWSISGRWVIANRLPNDRDQRDLPVWSAYTSSPTKLPPTEGIWFELQAEAGSRIGKKVSLTLANTLEEIEALLDEDHPSAASEETTDEPQGEPAQDEEKASQVGRGIVKELSVEADTADNASSDAETGAGDALVVAEQGSEVAVSEPKDNLVVTDPSAVTPGIIPANISDIVDSMETVSEDEHVSEEMGEVIKVLQSYIDSVISEAEQPSATSTTTAAPAATTTATTHSTATASTRNSNPSVLSAPATNQSSPSSSTARLTISTSSQDAAARKNLSFTSMTTGKAVVPTLDTYVAATHGSTETTTATATVPSSVTQSSSTSQTTRAAFSKSSTTSTSRPDSTSGTDVLSTKTATARTTLGSTTAPPVSSTSRRSSSIHSTSTTLASTKHLSSAATSIISTTRTTYPRISRSSISTPQSTLSSSTASATHRSSSSSRDVEPSVSGLVSPRAIPTPSVVFVSGGRGPLGYRLNGVYVKTGVHGKKPVYTRVPLRRTPVSTRPLKDGGAHSSSEEGEDDSSSERSDDPKQTSPPEKSGRLLDMYYLERFGMWVIGDRYGDREDNVLASVRNDADSPVNIEGRAVQYLQETEMEQRSAGSVNVDELNKPISWTVWNGTGLRETQRIFVSTVSAAHYPELMALVERTGITGISVR